jgi:ATP-binding cassette subfamily B protein
MTVAPFDPMDTATPPAGPEQARWVRRLWGYMLNHKRNLVLAFAAAIIGSAAQAVVPLLAREIVDDVILHHRSSLAPWLASLVGLGVVIFVGAYFRRFNGGRVALDVQYDLRNAMHDRLQSLDFETLDSLPTGQLVARANSDSTLVQALLSFLPIMTGNVLLLVSSLVIMLVLSPLLALVALVVAPTLLVVAYRMRDKVFPATWDGQQKEGDVAQVVDEDVSGVRVVKAFGQEERELRRLVGKAETLYGSRMRAVRLQSRYQPVLQAVPTLGQVAVLALGGYLALEHRLSIGTFLAFSTYLTQLVAPARMLAGILTVGQQARAGVERIFQLLDLPSRISDPPDGLELREVKGEIAFEAVRFAFGENTSPEATRGAPEVLAGLDLHLRPGEVVALVGASGSGKSVAVNLLPRFYDVTSGRLLVDGHDVRDVTLSSLRRHIGIVFEESFLFSDSVAANIAYGRPEATRAEIEQAARDAEAHGFIEELPDGYDTVVGERGLTLSGGQRQRISLARALLKDPSILILDDATSSVDAQVEERIHDAIRRRMAGRTMLLVAHRRSTLHLADRIAVMEHGRVVDEGSHDELLERSALYRSLLAGADQDVAEAPGDTIEALVTMSAWRRPAVAPGAPLARTFGRPAIGPGLGAGAGGGWRMNLAPTPELLAKVERLRPVRDVPRLDVASESEREVPFTLLAFLRRYRAPLGLGLVLVVLDSLASLAGPVLVRIGVDKGVVTGSKGALFGASAIFLLVSLLDLADMVGETFVTGRTAERLMLALRVKVFAQLQRLSLDYYEREMGGRIMTRMTTDVDQFESLLENGLLSALVSLFTFVGVGIALCAINLELALVTLSVVVPLAAATALFRAKAARIYDLARDRIAAVNADFQESLSGVREAQAFVHEATTRARFHELGRSYLEARIAAQRLVAVYFPFVGFLSDGADAIVLGVGAGLMASGHLTAGALIAFILYIDMFFSPIQQLSQVFDAWQQTRVSVARIADLLELEPLTPSRTGAAEPPRLSGALRLENVHFTYPLPSPRPGLESAGTPGQNRSRRAPEALKGVDLVIRPGETVALVGETGAGKSTVMKLLARFYDPVSGRVTADGSDLRDFELSSYRHQLGYVPQEAFLFTGTIRDNIAYGRPDASDAEVERAARAVGAHDFVAELDGGYLHVLSERGRSLSSGQRQLIALARAELVDPAILLLDEATSNLDLATEARVARAMRQVSHGRTTVVIAHRLQTAKAADRIVVLEAGRVVETGSHAGLLAAGGRYAAMWEAFELVGSVA